MTALGADASAASQPPDDLPDDEPAPTPAPPGVRRVLVATVRVLVAAAIVAAVGYATVTQWTQVRAYLLDLAWPSVLASLVLVLIGTFASTLGWRVVLTNLGHPVAVRTASQIYLIGLLAKYLPGSLWAFLLQAELGRRARLPRSRSLLALLTFTGISVTVSLLLGLFALPALWEVSRPVAIGTLLLLPFALVCTHPRLLTALLRRFLKLIRRPAEVTPITWRTIAVVVGWSTVTYVAYGVHLWLLVDAGSAPGLEGLVRCVGALALGLTAGMLAFLAPSGLGVREAIIVATMLPYTSAGTALGVALASRLVFTVADLVAAGAAALTGIRSRPAS